MTLLIDDYPLIVLPALAAEVGLNEALVLQQVHYWAERNSDGWVNHTVRRWREQFPFWSPSTIKRTIGRLRDRELLVVERTNEDPFDRSNRYRVNYDAVAAIERSTDRLKLTPSWTQIEPMSKETTNERETYISCDRDDVDELWDHVVAVLAPPNPKLTASRRTVLRRALNEAPLETCKRAVRGLKAYAAAKGGKLDISRVFKTRPGGDALADQIEWWASQAPSMTGTVTGTVSVPDWVKRNLRVYGEHGNREAQARVMGNDAASWLKERGLRAVWDRDELPARLVGIEEMT